jgi:hypothetical protein
MRSKLWAEIAGRADPNDPTEVIAPSLELLNDLLGIALRIETRGAALYRVEVRIHSMPLPSPAH